MRSPNLVWMTFIWKRVPKSSGGEPPKGEDTERQGWATFCHSTKHTGGKTMARGQQAQRKAEAQGKCF